MRQQRLPRTVTDCIELAALLGFDYLWVDSLCIVQDDAVDQAQQIRQMGSIYSSAFLAVLAAWGEDSDAGLPGLREGTRSVKQQEVTVIPASAGAEGLAVLECLKYYPKDWSEWYVAGQEDVDASRWNQRAWTMQEKALSPRTLVFTAEQVFWTCRQAYFCEESYFEIPGTRLRHFGQSAHAITIDRLIGGDPDPWQAYNELVDNYTRRSLTYSGDVYSAFQAISATVERSTNTGLLWGLPRSRFELALMWETLHGVTRRTARSTLPLTSMNKHVVFPSWSWMGWKGNASCMVGDSRRETYVRHQPRPGRPPFYYAC